MAIAMGAEHTIDRLNALLRGHGHRTNDGEFLWRSHFDEAGALLGIALRLLNRVYRSGAPMYFILDDTQTLKRGKKMDAVGKLYRQSEERYATGHTILKACLYCAGVTIPWGSWLYVKKEHVGRLKVPFVTLTELADVARQHYCESPSMNGKPGANDNKPNGSAPERISLEKRIERHPLKYVVGAFVAGATLAGGSVEYLAAQRIDLAKERLEWCKENFVESNRTLASAERWAKSVLRRIDKEVLKLQAAPERAELRQGIQSILGFTAEAIAAASDWVFKTHTSRAAAALREEEDAP